MDTIEQVLRNVIGKEETRTFNSYELLDVCTLKKEIINYNKKLHNIIKSNKIYFNNEVSFMLQIKKQKSFLKRASDYVEDHKGLFLALGFVIALTTLFLNLKGK